VLEPMGQENSPYSDSEVRDQRSDGQEPEEEVQEFDPKPQRSCKGKKYKESIAEKKRERKVYFLVNI